MKKLKHKQIDKNIHNQSLETVISDRFGRYSKYIIQDRALPDIRDGLKPVQRRILYAMHELGLTPQKPFKKSARIVGEVIGKYHPHGDSSIYDALIRMSQEWKMNIPLIEVHGNKGSIDDDPAAAMRYTETRLSSLSLMMMEGLKKQTVTFIPNFDDSEHEPTILPSLVPNLLVNGAIGIASGYATEMPPHNLGEIINAIIAKIENPAITLEAIMKIVQGPDFPTGGIVQGLEGIKDAFETGSGKIIIRAKIEKNLKGKNTLLKITEIPYGVVKTKIIRQINDIIYDNQINGIDHVRDESDRENQIQIVIELNPDSDQEQIINYLFAKTDLQIHYNYNNVVIQERSPKKLGLMAMIDAYLKHQNDIQKSIIDFDLKRDQKRAEIIVGLIKAAKIVDQIINLIKATVGSREAVVKALVEKLKFTKIQAEAISELKLYRLSKTDQSIFLTEQAELILKITQNKNLLSSQQEFDRYLISLLKKLKQQFSTVRKTTIESEIEKLTIDLDALIKHEETWIGVSRQGYIKRFSNRIYEANDIINYALKENDSLVYLHKINTVDKLLVFTSKGRFIFIPTHKIEEFKWKDVGKHVNDYATIAPDELVVDAIAINDFSLEAFLIFVTKKGKGKRVLLKDLLVSRYSRALRAINLGKDDTLVNVRFSNGKKHVIIMTKDGKAVRYLESELPIYSLNSSGVKAISLSNDDYVSVLVVSGANNTIGLVSNRGGLKRMRAYTISPMAKGTKGKQFFRVVKTHPHKVLDAKVVEPTTKVYFLGTKKREIHNFKNIEISTINSGFSLLASSKIIDASIMNYNRLNSDSSLFEKSNSQNDDEKFSAAEKVIESCAQISLDDMLINNDH